MGESLSAAYDLGADFVGTGRIGSDPDATRYTAEQTVYTSRTNRRVYGRHTNADHHCTSRGECKSNKMNAVKALLSLNYS